jgi:hypothetical protein
LQHVGPLVGDNAFLQIWPQIFAWFASAGQASVEAAQGVAGGESPRQAEARPHG